MLGGEPVEDVSDPGDEAVVSATPVGDEDGFVLTPGSGAGCGALSSSRRSAGAFIEGGGDGEEAEVDLSSCAVRKVEEAEVPRDVRLGAAGPGGDLVLAEAAPREPLVAQRFLDRGQLATMEVLGERDVLGALVVERTLDARDGAESHLAGSGESAAPGDDFPAVPGLADEEGRQDAQ